MDHSNRNRTPAELNGIEDALRAEKHQASPFELDRIKLQAIRQAERPRTSLTATKGSFMKSRLALTVLLVAGFMLSTTGATLAISGSSSTGSASSSQYTPAGTKEHHSENHVQGANTSGGNNCAENGGANGNGGNSGAGGDNCTEAQPTSAVEVAPTAEQQAVVSSGSSLPFTGFLAIPLLVIGLGLIVVGATLRLKSRNDPIA